MATAVIGKHWFYTKESEIRDQITTHHKMEVARAKRTGDTSALEAQLLKDYDWVENPSNSQIKRIHNAIENTLAYGTRDFHTSEEDLCRHILNFYSNALINVGERGGIVTDVLRDYGWSGSCRILRGSRNSRIQNAIQLALTHLKIQEYGEVCKSAAEGDELTPEEYTQYTPEELRIIRTAPRCFFNIATNVAHVKRGSFKDQMKKWNKTVQLTDRSTPFYQREIGRAHQHLIGRQLEAGQVFAKVRRYIPEYPRIRVDHSPEDLLEGSPLADHMIEEVERDMAPEPVTDPLVAFKGCHLEDIFMAYHRYIKNRSTKKRDMAAFHSFVECIKKGKKDPEVLFGRFEPSLRRMFGHIHDPKDFITAVLDSRPSYTEEIADLRDQKRIVIWLYMRIHGINDIPTGRSIAEAFDSHFRYFEHRGQIVDISAHTDEYISRSLEPLMKELQDPEFLRGTNEGLRRLMGENKTLELAFPSFTDRVFHVPEIVFSDYNRGAPQLRLTDGKSTTFDRLPPRSSVELSERRDVMEFVGGISAFCTDFAQRRCLDETLEQDLFRNILFLESQTVRNRSGTCLHLGIDPSKMFSEWNSSISSAESDSINVEWNEREGRFDVTLKQSFAVRMHESSVETQELRPTGLLTISTHFQLIPARDHWDWEGPEFRPEEIQFQPLYRTY